MDNRENKYEQLDRNTKKDPLGSRVRVNADSIAKKRNASEASRDKETRKVSSREKEIERSKINEEVKHIEHNKFSRANSNEAAAERRRIKEGSLDAIKRRDSLINMLKETPDFEKKNQVRNQMENIRISADTVADIRRKGLKDSPDKIAMPKELLHQKNYKEFKDKLYSKQIELNALQQRYIKVDDIMNLKNSNSQWNENNKAFWHHHGNSFNEYNEFAKKYPAIRERLAKGTSIEDLKKDRELKTAVNFWWSDSDKLKLTKYKDSHFIDSGFHRVALAKHHKFDEIPGYVTETTENEKKK